MQITAKKLYDEANLFCEAGCQDDSKRLLALVDSDEFRADPRFKKAMARAQKKPSRLVRIANSTLDWIECFIKVPLLTILAVGLFYLLKSLILI